MPPVDALKIKQTANTKHKVKGLIKILPNVVEYLSDAGRAALLALINETKALFDADLKADKESKAKRMDAPSYVTHLMNMHHLFTAQQCVIDIRAPSTVEDELDDIDEMGEFIAAAQRIAKRGSDNMRISSIVRNYTYVSYGIIIDHGWVHAKSVLGEHAKSNQTTEWVVNEVFAAGTMSVPEAKQYRRYAIMCRLFPALLMAPDIQDVLRLEADLQKLAADAEPVAQFLKTDHTRFMVGAQMHYPAAAYGAGAAAPAPVVAPAPAAPAAPVVAPAPAAPAAPADIVDIGNALPGSDSEDLPDYDSSATEETVPYADVANDDSDDSVEVAVA